MASVAGNFCDNDVPQMKFYLSSMMFISTELDALASAAALADAYCPEMRVIVEGAMAELGLAAPLPRR